jgi:hypothetical protein
MAEIKPSVSHIDTVADERATTAFNDPEETEDFDVNNPQVRRDGILADDVP